MDIGKLKDLLTVEEESDYVIFRLGWTNIARLEKEDDDLWHISFQKEPLSIKGYRTKQLALAQLVLDLKRE